MSNTDPNQAGGGAGQQAQIFCPNCKGGNAPEATTCRWCGQPLTGAATMPIGQPQPSPPVGQPTQAQTQYQQQPRWQARAPDIHHAAGSSYAESGTAFVPAAPLP